MKPTVFPTTAANPSFLDVCVDVSMDMLHVFCQPLMTAFDRRPWVIANRTDSIRTLLQQLDERAKLLGHGPLRVVVEATGVYHKHLTRVARTMEIETCLVNAEHVKNMRKVVFGDRGKTDDRDPRAIAAVSATGRLIIDRQLPEIYALLRGWAGTYQTAEDGIIMAKNEIHRLLKVLFPDFDFGTDFLYGNSGRAVQRCYGLNPHRIAPLAPSRLHERLRNHSRIMRRSVERLLAQARASITATPDGRLAELVETQLSHAFDDLDRHSRRRDKATAQLESLYDEARREDPNLPEATVGVISKKALARFFGEAGPLRDFDSWRQLLRYGGLNLYERKSGKYVGQTRISRQGRSALRHVMNQIALPLVRKGHLFGEYYHRKKEVEKMIGTKAMTAVSRKLIKLLWGWYHSGRAFDRSRVFHCESALQAA